MINKIRSENVKGYDVQGKDLNVNLDPTKINLCVAPNGFGKSSLATAFESLKRSRLEISEDNKHIGEKNEPSSLKLTAAQNCSSSIISATPPVHTMSRSHYSKTSTNASSIGKR